MIKTQKKITLSILVLVLLTSLSVGGFSIMFSIHTMQSNTDNYLREQVKAQALELNNVIDKIETAVGGLEKNVLSQLNEEGLNNPTYYESFSKRLESVANQYIKNNFNAMSIYVRFDPEISYGTAGIFYADTNADGRLEKLTPTDLTAYNPDDRERVAWFYEPLEAGSPIWLKPYYNANIDIEMVSYVRPLIVNGKRLGVVGADINFDQLRSIAERQIEAGKIIIIDKEQHFLVHDIYGINERIDTVDGGRLFEVYRAIEESNDGLMRYILEGEEKILSYSRLMNGWTVIVTLSLQEAFTEINNSIALFMSVVGTISIVMIFSSLYLGKYINKVMLSNSVLQKMVDDRTDQLNETNAYLQKSLAQIQSREAELTILNSQLEDTLEEMNKLQEEIIRTEKLEGLGSIVNGLSHEINTPLGLIITTNSFIQSRMNEIKKGKVKAIKPDDFTDIDDSLAIIEKASHRLRRLVKSFKMLTTEAHRQDIKRFDLVTVLARVVSDMKDSMEVLGHKIVITGEEPLTMISYPDVIEYIMKQLISNSLIHGSVDGQALLIEIHVASKGRFVQVDFKDNGRGISHEDMDKILEPFYSTTKNKGNVGLGLHIVHNLVTQVLKGQMTLIEDLNTGFGISIRLQSQREI